MSVKKNHKYKFAFVDDDGKILVEADNARELSRLLGKSPNFVQQKLDMLDPNFVRIDRATNEIVYK